MSTFEDLKLSKQLMKAIDKLGFTKPTLIQKDAIPPILQGKDVIGQSATGSGKTLAFAAGIIEHCSPKRQVQALVIVPTRELAEQVKDEVLKISLTKSLKTLAIYGGVSIVPQMKLLQTADVVIATPGRLLDHLHRGTIDTSKVKILVLDEADRMVEMGFIEDVEKIIRACPKNRQTLLFSATMDSDAQRIARKYMEEPVFIKATAMVDPSKLKQMYCEAPGKVKRELLLHLLKKEKSDLVMVFCNTRNCTETVDIFLRRNGIKSESIHGGLTQAKRLKNIDMFNRGQFQVLVCTDVAARGLDIKGVSHIYNYDIPMKPNDYVHRIGRTARAGKDGLIINIVSHRDFGYFNRILNVHSDYKIEQFERPYLRVDPNSGSDSRGGRSGSSSYGRRDSGRSDSRGGRGGSSYGGSSHSSRSREGSSYGRRDSGRSDSRGGRGGSLYGGSSHSSRSREGSSYGRRDSGRSDSRGGRGGSSSREGSSYGRRDSGRSDSRPRRDSSSREGSSYGRRDSGRSDSKPRSGSSSREGSSYGRRDSGRSDSKPRSGSSSREGSSYGRRDSGRSDSRGGRGGSSSREGSSYNRRDSGRSSGRSDSGARGGSGRSKSKDFGTDKKRKGPKNVNYKPTKKSKSDTKGKPKGKARGRPKGKSK